MNKEELYKLALSDVVKYSLLNEIFAIRDKRVETVDYTIGVNGFISLDVLNDYVKLQQKIDTYENPEDLTLFYMWLDEKSKDKLKQLEQERDKYKSIVEGLNKFTKERINFLEEEKKEFEEDLYNDLEVNRDEIRIRECNITQLEDVLDKIKELEEGNSNE